MWRLALSFNRESIEIKKMKVLVNNEDIKKSHFENKRLFLQ
jgi:hypothetical protein